MPCGVYRNSEDTMDVHEGSMKMLATLVGLGLAVSATAGLSSQEGTHPAPRADGRALFLTYCSSCHGVTGRGDGPVAESLSVRPRDLTQLATTTDQAFVAARIERLIDGRDPLIRAHGSVEMPVWGDAFRRREGLSEEAIAVRIRAIVDYLRSIQRRLG